MFIHTLHIFALREPRARQRDRLMDEFEARKGMHATNERQISATAMATAQ
jgi:hypothetical protein